MSNKLNRIKKLPGAESSVDFKRVKLMGLPELTNEMREIANQAKEATAEITKMFQALASELTKDKSSKDMNLILKSLQSLEKTIAAKTSYTIHFERDKQGLMKSGIKLVPGK